MELILQFASSHILFGQFCACQNHNCLLYTKKWIHQIWNFDQIFNFKSPRFFPGSIWEGSTPHLAYFGGRGDSSSGKSSFQQYFYQDHHVSVRKITSANRFCSVKTTHPKVLIRAALRRPRHFCLPQLRLHVKFIILCYVLPYNIVALYNNMEPKTHDQSSIRKSSSNPHEIFHSMNLREVSSSSLILIDIILTYITIWYPTKHWYDIRIWHIHTHTRIITHWYFYFSIYWE